MMNRTMTMIGIEMGENMTRENAVDLFVVADESQEDSYFLLPIELLKQVSPILLNQLSKAKASIHPTTIAALVKVCKALKLPAMSQAEIENERAAIENGSFSTVIQDYAKIFIQEAVSALKKPVSADDQHQSVNEYKEKESAMNDEKKTPSNMNTLQNAAATHQFVIGSITENGLSVSANPRTHANIHDAQAECERLAITNPGKRFVPLQMHGSVVVGKPAWN